MKLVTRILYLKFTCKKDEGKKDKSFPFVSYNNNLNAWTFSFTFFSQQFSFCYFSQAKKNVKKQHTYTLKIDTRVESPFFSSHCVEQLQQE